MKEEGQMKRKFYSKVHSDIWQLKKVEFWHLKRKFYKSPFWHLTILQKSILTFDNSTTVHSDIWQFSKVHADIWQLSLFWHLTTSKFWHLQLARCIYLQCVSRKHNSQVGTKQMRVRFIKSTRRHGSLVIYHIQLMLAIEC